MATVHTSASPRRQDKLLVIMGATGAGKSRFSLNLATRFEIVNSDKIQLYRGLDITTNKLPIPERLGVPHHLLGKFDPLDGDFTPANFRAASGQVVSGITNRKRVAMLVGWSKSIHTMVADRFEAGSNVFELGSDASLSAELRFNCCFLWVDVSMAVLTEYLLKLVDKMLDSRMYEELGEFCDPDCQDRHDPSAVLTGLRKAIRVPEFTRYFKKYPQSKREEDDDRERRGAYFLTFN